MSILTGREPAILVSLCEVPCYTPSTSLLPQKLFIKYPIPPSIETLPKPNIARSVYSGIRRAKKSFHPVEKYCTQLLHVWV